MIVIDKENQKLLCDRKEWECYSKTPDHIIEEVNSLIYSVITTNTDPVVAQKIIYDTLKSNDWYSSYGFRDSEGDRCTTNIINKYYGSYIDRWANLRLAAEEKGENWAIPVPMTTKLKEEKKTVPLSNKTIDNLANALKEDVINYILEDERYTEFMQEVLNDAIQSYLGRVDPDLLMELNVSLFSSINLR